MLTLARRSCTLSAGKFKNCDSWSASSREKARHCNAILLATTLVIPSAIRASRPKTPTVAAEGVLDFHVRRTRGPIQRADTYTWHADDAQWRLCCATLISRKTTVRRANSLLASCLANLHDGSLCHFRVTFVNASSPRLLEFPQGHGPARGRGSSIWGNPVFGFFTRWAAGFAATAKHREVLLEPRRPTYRPRV